MKFHVVDAVNLEAAKEEESKDSEDRLQFYQVIVQSNEKFIALIFASLFILYVVCCGILSLTASLYYPRIACAGDTLDLLGLVIYKFYQCVVRRRYIFAFVRVYIL